MRHRDLGRRAEALRRRVAALQKRAARPGRGVSAAREVLEELCACLEELQVADAELRRQNEELAVTHRAVEAERQRYRALFDLAPDGYLVTDPEGTIQEANRAAAELLDVPPEFLLGKPLVVFVAEKERRAFRRRLGRIRRDAAKARRWETELRPHAGGTLPTALTVGLVRARGRLIGLGWLLRDITPSKRAEEILRRAQAGLERRVQERTLELEAEKARWQATVENMLDPVTTCDAEGRATYMNAAYARLIARQIQPGLALEEHAAHYALYHPDGRLFESTDLPLQRAALTGQEVRSVELIQRRSDGREVIGIWNAAPLRDREGGVTGAVAVGRDITAERRAEAFLRQSVDAYRTLAENSPDVIDRFDERGVHLYVNPAGATLHGVPAQAILGKTIEETGMPEPFAGLWRERIQTVFRTGQPLEVETDFPTAGGLRTFHSRLVPEHAPGGSIASVLVVSHDVTERKRAEEALRESERLRRLAQQAARAGAWEWNISTGEAIWSEESYALYGFQAGQVAPTYDAWLQCIHPDDRDTVGQGVARAVREHSELDLEFRIVCPDGAVRWLNERGHTFYDAAGRPGRMIGITLDVTDRKQAEQALRNALELMEQRLKERTPERRPARPPAAAPAGEPSLEAEIERLGGDLERRTGELIALDRLAEAVNSSLDLAVVLPRLLEEVRRLLATEGAAVLLHEPAEDVLCAAAAEGAGTERMVGMRLPVEGSLVRPVLRDRRVLLLNDVPGSSRYSERFQELVGGGIRSVLLVPLVCRGTAIGILGTANRAKGGFDQSDAQTLAAVANIAAIAIENARLFGEVREAHERLRRVSRQLVQVQETERREIARELHDEIGQILTGLKLVLDMGQSAASGLERERLAEAQDLAKELLARVRELSLDLRPAMLDDLGLLPALLWHFERFGAQTGVRVTVQHTGVEGRRFPPEVESAAYRVMQEALTNVARHAGVREAAVRLWAEARMLGAQVEDRGRGFDVEPALASPRSTGLLGMRERAALLGGRLTVEARPGTGTRVTVEFPVGPASPQTGEEAGG